MLLISLTPAKSLCQSFGFRSFKGSLSLSISNRHSAPYTNTHTHSINHAENSMAATEKEDVGPVPSIQISWPDWHQRNLRCTVPRLRLFPISFDSQSVFRILPPFSTVGTDKRVKSVSQVNENHSIWSWTWERKHRVSPAIFSWAPRGMYQQQLLEHPNAWNVYVKAPHEDSSAELLLSVWRRCSGMAGDTWSPDYLTMTADSSYLMRSRETWKVIVMAMITRPLSATSRQAVFQWRQCINS